MSKRRKHINDHKSRLKESAGKYTSKDSYYGESARGMGGWVILQEQESGNRSTVGCPMPTCETARKTEAATLSALMEDVSGCNPNLVALDYFVEKLEPRWADGLCANDHEWVVYSTALREGWLMVQCVECGAVGTIHDPSAEEKSEAFYAPARPYRWQDNTRVIERRYASPNVIRFLHGPQCECPSQCSLPNNKGYERIPGGIWEDSGRLSYEEKNELTLPTKVPSGNLG